MTYREIIQKRLNHERTDVTPYTVDFEFDVYRRLSEYYKDENWESKKLAKFTYSYLGIDTVMMEEGSDLFGGGDAMAYDGYGTLWKMDKWPPHIEKPALVEPNFDGYAFPSADKFINPVLARKEQAIEDYINNTEQYRIIGMGWGIFEHAWQMRGFEDSLTDVILEEDFYSELTTRLTDLYIDMLKSCEDVPADAYLFGDDWGDQRGIIIGAERWRKFIKPCWERIYKEVHRQGKKVIQHSCGSIAEIYDDLAEIGMDCHESVQPEAFGMEPSSIKKTWGKKISFWGCLGNQSTLYSGTPAEIRKEIFRLRDLFKNDGGFVLAPAKPLPYNMPIEKAVAVVEALSELNI